MTNYYTAPTPDSFAHGRVPEWPGARQVRLRPRACSVWWRSTRGVARWLRQHGRRAPRRSLPGGSQRPVDCVLAASARPAFAPEGTYPRTPVPHSLHRLVLPARSRVHRDEHGDPGRTAQGFIAVDKIGSVHGSHVAENPQALPGIHGVTTASMVFSWRRREGRRRGNVYILGRIGDVIKHFVTVCPRMRLSRSGDSPGCG